MTAPIKWSKDMIDTMLAMRKQGHSWEAISKKVGVYVPGCINKYTSLGYTSYMRFNRGPISGTTMLTNTHPYKTKQDIAAARKKRKARARIVQEVGYASY